MLDQFRVLLSKSPLTPGADHGTQLNVYISGDQAKLRADSTNPTYRSLCQDLDMFSLLLERCNLLEARGDPRGVLQPNNQLQEDLCNLLPPVKVWCDGLIV